MCCVYTFQMNTKLLKFFFFFFFLENVLKIAEEARFHLKLNLQLPSYFLLVSCHPVISSLSLSFLSFKIAPIDFHSLSC